MEIWRGPSLGGNPVLVALMYEAKAARVGARDQRSFGDLAKGI